MGSRHFGGGGTNGDTLGKYLWLQSVPIHTFYYSFYRVPAIYLTLFASLLRNLWHDHGSQSGAARVR